MAKVDEKAEGVDGNGAHSESEGTAPEHESTARLLRAIESGEPATAEFVRRLVHAAVACGMPAPGTRAYEAWLDDVFKRPNVSPGDGQPAFHFSGRAFDDDPNGARAWAALALARRRWDERARYTGRPGAVAVANLLRFMDLAGAANISEDEHAERLRVLGRVARGVDGPSRAWSGDTRSSAPADRIFEFAAGMLSMWSSAPTRSFPHLPASEVRTLEVNDASDDGIARVFMGALLGDLTHLTHGGPTIADREAHADRVARAIATELNKRRAKFQGQLFSAENNDKCAPHSSGPTKYLDDARRAVAFGMAVAVFTGVYIANGERPTRARRHAESTMANVRAQLSEFERKGET